MPISQLDTMRGIGCTTISTSCSITALCQWHRPGGWPKVAELPYGNEAWIYLPSTSVNALARLMTVSMVIHWQMGGGGGGGGAPVG